MPFIPGNTVVGPNLPSEAQTAQGPSATAAQTSVGLQSAANMHNNLFGLVSNSDGVSTNVSTLFTYIYWLVEFCFLKLKTEVVLIWNGNVRSMEIEGIRGSTTISPTAESLIVITGVSPLKFHDVQCHLHKINIIVFGM